VFLTTDLGPTRMRKLQPERCVKDFIVMASVMTREADNWKAKTLNLKTLILQDKEQLFDGFGKNLEKCARRLAFRIRFLQ